MMSELRRSAPVIGSVAIALVLCLTFCLFDGVVAPCAVLLVLAGGLLPIVLEPAGRPAPTIERAYSPLRADVHLPPPKSLGCSAVV